jgi:hypothetical protein
LALCETPRIVERTPQTANTENLAIIIVNVVEGAEKCLD